MVPSVGDAFGPYKILGPVGVGGMGMVFRAQDMRLHREVAIKVLADHLNVPEMKERFLREARAASALNHPNICTLFDIGEQNGTPYLVMELLHGQTIKQMAAGNPMSVEQILDYGAQAADALAAAHAKGVVHRDIKSANVFVVDQGHGAAQVKILDFGLAKMDSGDTMVTSSGQLMATSLDQGLTSPGSTVGTVAYMSPEQAKGEPLDPRTDIFSMGSVLYEMATGSLPFPGATSALVFVGLLSKDPVSIRASVPGFSPELEKIIFRCLAKERTDRYQTARELRQDLLRLTARESSGSVAVASAPVASPVTAAPQAPPVPTTPSGIYSEVTATPAADTVHEPEQRADFMKSALTRPAEPQTGRARNQQRESPFVHAEDLASMVSIPVAKMPVETSSGSVSIPAPARPKQSQSAAPQPSTVKTPVASSSVDEAPPKNNAGMLIGIALVVVLAIAGFAWYHFASGSKSGVEESSAIVPAVPAADATPQQVRAYLNAGQLKNKALPAAEALAKKDPKSPDSFALQQEVLNRTGALGAAQEIYKSAVAAGQDKSGAVHAEELLTSRLLRDSAGEQAQLAWAASADQGYLVTIAEGYALEDEGKLAAANSAWQDGGRRAKLAGDTNAAASAFAASALANALNGNCTTVAGQSATALSLTPSARAQAKAGVALGLCRSSEAPKVADTMQHDHSDDPLVKELYMPEVQAAIAIGSSNGAAALQALNGVAKYDLGSLAPYLRGLADIETKQPNLAVGDFGAIKEHRDAFVAGRLLCSRMALQQLVKAYTLLGDRTTAARISQELQNY